MLEKQHEPIAFELVECIKTQKVRDNREDRREKSEKRGEGREEIM